METAKKDVANLHLLTVERCPWYVVEWGGVEMSCRTARIARAYFCQIIHIYKSPCKHGERNLEGRLPKCRQWLYLDSEIRRGFLLSSLHFCTATRNTLIYSAEFLAWDCSTSATGKFFIGLGSSLLCRTVLCIVKC